MRIYATSDKICSIANIIISSQSSSLDLPVGTILPYTGKLSDIPSGWHLCDGSNGTPNLSGRFLEGVTSGAKQWHDAGLPNIKGSFSGHVMGWRNSTTTTGAFYSYAVGNRAAEGNNNGGSVPCFVFDASRSNSIYGRSGTVQPRSYTVYYIMRVK